MTSLALVEGHRHQVPHEGGLDDVLGHAVLRDDTERVGDNSPVVAALTAAVARCAPCQERVAAWLAAHGDPRTIVRLTAVVAQKGYQLAVWWLRARARDSGTPVAVLLRSILSTAFGKDVVNVATSLSAGNVPAAVDQVRRLEVERREILVRSLLSGIAHPPPTALLALAAVRQA